MAGMMDLMAGKSSAKEAASEDSAESKARMSAAKAVLKAIKDNDAAALDEALAMHTSCCGKMDD